MATAPPGFPTREIVHRGNRYTVLVCPVCGSDRLRPMSLRCNPAGASGTEIDVIYDGIHSRPTDRSSVLTIGLTLHCRCGHVIDHQLLYGDGRISLHCRTGDTRRGGYTTMPAIYEPKEEDFDSLEDDDD